jgi:hypothetical protein
MSDDDKDPGKKGAATVLVELALNSYDLGLSIDGEPFGIPVFGPRIVHPLRGGKPGLRAELARKYRDKTGKVAAQQALADALLTLEGEAAQAEPQSLALRVAETGESLWLDLGDTTGRAVRINAAGWQVMDAAPVLFKRTVLTGSLPTPTGGGDLGALWALVNIAEADRPIAAALLVSQLYPNVPHPIGALLGEQGTGKTTAAKMLTSLIDPSPVQVRKAPRDADTWITAASGSWVVAIDNLSDINDWLSDTLCRAVTGDGDVRRQLYTDGGLAVFAFRRCVLLTGIDMGALRGDLADRLLPIDLHLIADRDRRLDADLEREWRAAHARILGALLDLAASVIRVLPSVRLDSLPRMADFARVLAAVDQVLDTEGLARYVDRAGSLAADSLTGDEFVMALSIALTDAFEGTSSQLLDRVHPPDEKRPPKGWPANGRAVTTLLKRQAPVMRRAGWTVDQLPAGHDNAIRWFIARPEKAGNGHSQHSQGSQDTPSASDASDASNEYGQSQDGLPLHLVEPDDDLIDESDMSS